MDISKLIRTEKYLFLAVIIVGSLSVLTRGEFFTNFMMVEDIVDFKRFFLVVVNTLIGLKVAVGLVIIFTIFMGEGKS